MGFDICVAGSGVFPWARTHWNTSIFLDMSENIEVRNIPVATIGCLSLGSGFRVSAFFRGSFGLMCGV